MVEWGEYNLPGDAAFREGVMVLVGWGAVSVDRCGNAGNRETQGSNE